MSILEITHASLHLSAATTATHALPANLCKKTEWVKIETEWQTNNVTTKIYHKTCTALKTDRNDLSFSIENNFYSIKKHIF